MVARADARAKLTRVELFPPRFSTGYGTNSYVVLMLAEKPRKEKACPCPPPRFVFGIYLDGNIYGMVL